MSKTTIQELTKNLPIENVQQEHIEPKVMYKFVTKKLCPEQYGYDKGDITYGYVEDLSFDLDAPKFEFVVKRKDIELRLLYIERIIYEKVFEKLGSSEYQGIPIRDYNNSRYEYEKEGKPYFILDIKRGKKYSFGSSRKRDYIVKLRKRIATQYWKNYYFGCLKIRFGFDNKNTLKRFKVVDYTITSGISVGEKNLNDIEFFKEVKTIYDLKEKDNKYNEKLNGMIKRIEDIIK